MQKKQIVSAVLIVGAMSAYGFVKGFLRGALEPPGSPEAIRSELSAMNLGLPKTIDPDLVMDGTSVDDHRVAFHYKILTRPGMEVESKPFVAQVREKLVSGTCSDRDLAKRFLSHDTTVAHTFRGNDNVPIATIEVKPSDCPK